MIIILEIFIQIICNEFEKSDYKLNIKNEINLMDTSNSLNLNEKKSKFKSKL